MIEIEDRKEFVRAFVAGITVVPDEPRIELQMPKNPGGPTGILYL
jgi:hypothetical protein